jgi:DNA polymerase I
MAHESRDKALCRVFEQDLDMHNMTASEMFGTAVGNVKPFQRQAGKIVGFGIINGISAPGLVDQMILYRATKEDGSKWTESDCDDMLKEWFKIYPGVRKFQNETVEETRQTGLVREGIAGRVRYLPAVWSPIPYIRSEAERQSYSHKIQAGAQSFIQLAMKPVWDVVCKSGVAEPLLQVHDELLMELADREEDRQMCDEMVVHCLTTTTQLRVPVKADGGFGRTWLEAH